MRFGIPKHKTYEQVRSEIRRINKRLLPLYNIIQEGNGVRLVRGDNTIICKKGSYGGDEGLYEVRPSVSGNVIKELFGRRDEVIGHLELKDAVEIVEASVTAQKHPHALQTLREILAEH